jgi:hypothetical protein
MQSPTRIHQQAPVDCERWVLLLSLGVDSCEAWPHWGFARPLSCALRASCRSAPNFAVLPPWLRHGLLGMRSPCCSRKWSGDSPKRCSAQRLFQRRLRAPSRPGGLSWRKPKLQRCGSSERRSGLEVRPPNRSQSCPPKSGPTFFDVWNLPQRRVRAVGGADLRLRSVAQARRAPFDNPSRSWDINRSTVPRLRPRVKREHGRLCRRSVAAPATVSGVSTHFSPLGFS